MKYVSYLFLLGGLWVAQIGAQAQDNQYLDDAYLSRKDVKLLQEKAKVLYGSTEEMAGSTA